MNETLYIPDDFSWYGLYNTKEIVKELFNHTLTQQLKSNLQPQSIRAIFVPHAGLNFSGLCSAAAYHSIINQHYTRIMLIYYVQIIIWEVGITCLNLVP